jgi:D-alanyl-D-alanine carboxypeptidase (penicillin-binding protein 5/6)
MAGSPAAIPVPAEGSLTLADARAGIVADRDGDAVRPIGSVAKTMTALVVLDAHPLAAGDAGPLLTMTPDDVSLYHEAIAGRGSATAVSVGQRWTERQLLLALLLPSANNIAVTLGRWVAGSDTAFVSRLNTRAAELGMSHTYFDDSSGVSPRTVSTSRDLVRLGAAALAEPALAGIVATRSALLPGGARVDNLDVLLWSQPGWLGVKTGWTPQAGGCLLFAASRAYAPGTPEVTLVGAVLAQPPDAAPYPSHPELGGAVRAAQAAAVTELGNFNAVDLASLAPSVTGSISSRWGAGARLGVVPGARRVVVVRRGTAMRVTLSVMSPPAPLARGARVGRLQADTAAGTVVTWGLDALGPVAEPPWWWRLFAA